MCDVLRSIRNEWEMDIRASRLRIRQPACERDSVEHGRYQASVELTPGSESVYYPGQPMATLLDRHLERLENRGEVVRIRDDSELESSIVEAEQISLSYQIQSGYCVRLEPDEVRILQALWRPDASNEVEALCPE